MDKNGRGLRAQNTPADTNPLPTAKKRAEGRLNAPADLREFLRTRPVRQAAAALGLSHGLAHQLSRGYWPEDPARIMQAWRGYQCRLASQTAPIRAVRRVYAGGSVRHAGRHFCSPGLCGHEGSMVGICRAQDGQIMAVVFGQGSAANTYYALQPRPQP